VKVRRIDFSPDEWLAGTLELSGLDRGVYITLCALIYSRGENISEKLVISHCNDHGNRVRASLDRLEKAGKIVRNGLEIVQKRCRKELEIAQKRVEKASENGRLGNQIKGLKHATRGSTASTAPHANHQLPTINYQLYASPTERRANGRAASPEEDIFNKGLALLGTGKRGLIRKLLVKFGAEIVENALGATERRQPAEPVAFFVACCEERKPGPDPPAASADPPPPPKPVNPRFLGHGDNCMCSNCEQWQLNQQTASP